MDLITYTGWRYIGCFNLPYQYDDEEIAEIVERLGKKTGVKLNDIYRKARYGSLHVWCTLVSAIEAQEINLNLSDKYYQNWLFINGELSEKNTIYIYPGSHRLVIVRFYKDEKIDVSRLHLNFCLSTGKGISLKKSDSVMKSLSIHDIPKLEEYLEGSVSKNGKFTSTITKKGNLELDKYEYQVSLYKIDVKKEQIYPRWSAKYNEPHSIIFSPDSKYMVFVCVSNDGYWDEIVSIALEDGNEKILVSGLHNANNLCWEPNSQGIFFVCDDDNQTPEEYNSLHFQSLTDRMPWWRRQKVVGHITFNGDYRGEEMVKRITPRMFDVHSLQIAKERNELIYIEETRGNLSEPYLYLHRLDLTTYDKNTIRLPNAFITSIMLSPSNNYFAYIGSRVKDIKDKFTSLDNIIFSSERKFPGYEINVYDTRTFVLNLEDRTIKQLNINIEMQASIPIGTSRIKQEIYWVDNENLNYIATSGSQTSIVFSNISDNQDFSMFAIGNGVSKNHSFTGKGDCFCFYSYEGKPYTPALYSNKKVLTLFNKDTNTDVLSDISWHNFEYIKESKVKDAWIYLPKNTNSLNTTPLVIYLYGGASPLTSGFDDLHQILVTHGIAVLVLNPSGCAGYGAYNADLHVNDWGKKTVEEISKTVEEIIQSYPTINKSAIGIYGGSYGGFLSDLLIAQTNLFKAACTIGGISNITSYWGSSYFGYLYGLSALSNSYPWSNKDIFINQSPIFSSQNINTPLLMLHGGKDMNVPLTESEQLFTALKVQNKEVSLIVFPEEQHPIKSKPISYFYQKSYIIAWFEKHLKKDNTLWNKFINKGIEQVY